MVKAMFEHILIHICFAAELLFKVFKCNNIIAPFVCRVRWNLSQKEQLVQTCLSQHQTLIVIYQDPFKTFLPTLHLANCLIILRYLCLLSASYLSLQQALFLVLICPCCTCDISVNTACITAATYGNMHCHLTRNIACLYLWNACEVEPKSTLQVCQQ